MFIDQNELRDDLLSASVAIHKLALNCSMLGTSLKDFIYNFSSHIQRKSVVTASVKKSSAALTSLPGFEVTFHLFMRFLSCKREPKSELDAVLLDQSHILGDRWL